jgi:hypothetical protein
VDNSNKENLPVRRPSFVFEDVQFFEDPCKETTVLYAYAGIDGKGGVIDKPVMMVGPAALLKKIKEKLAGP